MANHDLSRNQTSQYDKIIKENLEVTLPIIIRDLLGLDIRISEELPDAVQHTKERIPDALKKITDSSGDTYVLQVEFQVEDEKEMIYRMAEYYIMLMRRYQLAIHQYVIFLKDTKPIMPTYIITDHFKYDFKLISIAETSYKLFLMSNSPEVKMLGLLANFGKEDSYQAVREIIEGVTSVTEGDFAESRYFKQMRIFIQLRSNIEKQFEKAMEQVTKFFKEENDFLYRKGETNGEAKKSHLVVENLIVKLGFTDEQAAEVAEVDLAFVKKVRAELNKK